MCFKNKYLVMLLIGSAIVTTACGKKDGQEADKTETQVVAKVNGDEISIHQINYQLGRATQNNPTQLNEAQSKAAAKQILARLVDQQLLKQKAIEVKLDRDPRILQALESSKNEILAQAYLEQLMSTAAKPSSTQIDNFYNENPELFANRRVFRLQELVVDIGKDKFDEVENNLKTIKGINEVANWLKSKNYPFTANSNVRAAEQLPLELLKRIQPLKDGELIAVRAERSLNILHIAASQSVPIARDKATPTIEQYFLNQNKTALAKKEMAALNTSAKVEFVGAFSDMKKSELTQPITSRASAKVAPVELEQKAQSDISSANQDSVKPIDLTKPSDSTKLNSKDTDIDKGLAGL